MEWSDEGILLEARKYSESSSIIEVFTSNFGRYKGIVKGGQSRKMVPFLQPGSQLKLVWRARLQEHLGIFKVEPLRVRSAFVLNERIALSGLNAVTGMLCSFLPEREAYSSLFGATEVLLDMLDKREIWPISYLKWEMGFLDVLGYGLDLSKCTVTGSKDNLKYISPKTGKAVSSHVAGEWARRLFPLLPIIRDPQPDNDHDIVKALEIVGHFFEKHAAQDLGLKQMPASRERLIETIRITTKNENST